MAKHIPVAAKKIIGQTILAWLFSFLLFCIACPDVAEWYMVHLYPLISAIISTISQSIAFSLYDLFWSASILYVLYVVIRGIIQKTGFKKIVKSIIVFALWWILLFYYMWGISYFRKEYYSRHNKEKVAIETADFIVFAERYIDEINRIRLGILPNIPRDSVIQEINDLYTGKLNCRKEWYPAVLSPKYMIYSSGMAAMGIKGYIGAFFAEPTLNTHLLETDFPFTYAHELAHVYGISSEAEANYYAFRVGDKSANNAIRYSAYLSILPYLLGSMYALPEEERNRLAGKISEEVKKDYRTKREHWMKLYSPTVGEVQEKLYDLFLKGNQVSSGTENYSEVIEFLVRDNMITTKK